MSITFFFDKDDKLLGHLIITFRLGRRSWPWDWLLPPWWLVAYLLLLIGAGLAFHVRQRRNAGRSPIPNFSRRSTWRVRIGFLLLVGGAIASLFVYSDLKRRGPFWDK